MEQNLKKILSLNIVLVLFISMLATSVWAETAAVTASGTCGSEGTGSNLTWVLTEGGTLTISGTGKMADYLNMLPPWCDYKPSIKRVVIAPGVTYIGSGAFMECHALKTISIPTTVTSVGELAFFGCQELSDVFIPASMSSLKRETFASCGDLEMIRFEGNAPEIIQDSFRATSAVAYYPMNDSSWTDEAKQGYGGTLVWVGTVAYGICGDEGDGSNLSWLLIEDGTLIISGDGLMADYSSTNAPWTAYSKSINKVIIEAGVTSISANAFAGCNKITEIRFAADAPEIAKSAFHGVSATALYPNGNESWTNSILQNYEGALRWESYTPYLSYGYCGKNEGTSVWWNLDVEGTLTIDGQGPMVNFDIDNSFFYNNQNIKKLVIANGVTTIGDYAFYGCNALDTVTIGDSVASIGSWAFSGCNSLTEVAIPDSVSFIGFHAFCVCRALSKVYFQGNAPISNGYSLFQNVSVYYPAENGTWTKTVMQNYGSNITWVAVEGNALASGYCGGEDGGTNLGWTLTTDGVLTISGEGEMAEWTSNASVPWYSYKDAIKTVVIKSGVTTIGDRAFNEHTMVSQVTIPSTVTVIGESAFSWCSALTQITIPKSVAIINSDAFRGCSSLAKATINSAVIGAYAFRECSALTSVTLGDSVAVIGDFAFFWCDALAKVTIPSSVTFIGSGAFCGCRLTEVTIPASVTSIGNSPFADCRALTAIYVAEDNPNYSSDSFGVLFNKKKTTLIDAPNAIKTYAIPNSVASIGNGAFAGCYGLTDVSIPSSVTSIGSDAFAECIMLTEVIIPSSVITIGRGAFISCTALTEVNIPNSITNISGCLFYGCSSLVAVAIPDSVVSIGEGAFSGCSALTAVRFVGDAPTFGNDVFDQVVATVYYPAEGEAWTEQIMKDYGGDINWKPLYTAAIHCISSSSTETTVAVWYNPDAVKTVVAFLACYDTEGRLMRLKMVSEQANSDGTITISVSYTEAEYAEIGRISAFVMDGDTMAPLCASWDPSSV